MTKAHSGAATRFVATVGLCVLGVAAAAAADGAKEPLHVRIDRLMDAAQIGPAAPLASDAEFLRRVSLDLSGMPPSVDELRLFLADTSADKRARAIDRLIAGPLFTRHWATTLDVMLMERRASRNVPEAEWHAYLLAAARENRPLNQIVSELIRADGTDPKNRGPARFYLDRELEPNLIARDVGRIFFGRDLQCAHCHDHPLVEDYRQSDYYGLLAFFAPGYDPVTKEGEKKTAYPEKAATDLTFDSVFIKTDHHRTGPRLPGGPELPEPVFSPGDEYKVKPTDKVLAVPRHSRRVMLASLATDGSNRAFNENLANRLWAMMMGRGLVHPLDLAHPANPPSHPELLRMLGEELAAMKFNGRTFLRELAMTRAYQRAIDLPADDAAAAGRIAEEKSRLQSGLASLESAAERTKQAYTEAVKAWHKAEDAAIPLAAELDKILAQHDEAAKKEEQARKASQDADAALAARREVARALAAAAATAQEAVKKLPGEKPLAEAAGVFTTRSKAIAAEVAALEKAAVPRAAALKKQTDERTALAKSVEASRTKLQPVRESVRRMEVLALGARSKMADARVALEDHNRRIAVLESYEKWAALRRQADAHRRELDTRRGARANAEATFARHKQATERMKAAVAATRSAQEVLPADQAVVGAVKALEARAAELEKATAGLQAAAERERSALAAALTRDQALAASLTEAADDLATRLGDRFTVGRLKPLTPEQIGWSILAVTGVYERYAKTEEAALAKTGPPPADDAARRARAVAVEERTFDKLKGNIAAFVSVYGAGAGQPQGDFFATVDQALFVANGGSVNSWTAPAGGNVSQRMLAQADPRKSAEDLYLTILSRPPTADETAEVARMLAVPEKDRGAVVQELVWGLITSAEFRFNH